MSVTTPAKNDRSTAHFQNKHLPAALHVWFLTGDIWRQRNLHWTLRTSETRGRNDHAFSQMTPRPWTQLNNPTTTWSMHWFGSSHLAKRFRFIFMCVIQAKWTVWLHDLQNESLQFLPESKIRTVAWCVIQPIIFPFYCHLPRAALL